MYCANIKCKKRIWTAPAVKGLTLFQIKRFCHVYMVVECLHLVIIIC